MIRLGEGAPPPRDGAYIALYEEDLRVLIVMLIKRAIH
ncbi:MAG: hypothetical protein ACI8X5_000325 [Planctomycetota bacterium]|jgi:hypothetical protein